MDQKEVLIVGNGWTVTLKLLEKPRVVDDQWVCYVANKNTIDALIEERDALKRALSMAEPLLRSHRYLFEADAALEALSK